jgi:glycerol-1-phosphate dehydrogenase [NAD(P)+]
LVKIGKGKIKKIGRYLSDKDLNNIALFWGEGLEKSLGRSVNKALKEYDVKILHKQDVKSIEVGDINKVAFNLSPSVDAVVGIGGGKALDFAKYAAYLLKLPFISVPTSTSNDGFCSPTSSLTVEKSRKSVKSGIPFGIVIDLDIIEQSPDIFIYSGIGDMISKITALNDWKTAADKKKARYSDFASLIAYNSLDLLFNRYATDINDPKFQRSMATSLLMSGVAMEIAGSSRPASGSEHLISHALDNISKKPKIHGLQVGVATYLCALLQNNNMTEGVADILESTGFFDAVRKDPFDKKEFIEALKKAPDIKNDFYTVLSRKDSFKRAVKFIETNEILKTLIV